MTPASRLQGRVFCCVALVLVIACLVGARLQPRHELLAVGALVLLLGTPRGAFDVQIARRLLRVAGFPAWALFSLGYLGLSAAAAAAAVWLVAPTLF